MTSHPIVDRPAATATSDLASPRRREPTSIRRRPTVIVTGPRTAGSAVAAWLGGADWVADRLARLPATPGPGTVVVALVDIVGSPSQCCWSTAALVADLARLTALGIAGSDTPVLAVPIGIGRDLPFDPRGARQTASRDRDAAGLGPHVQVAVADGGAADVDIGLLADRMCVHDHDRHRPLIRSRSRLWADVDWDLVADHDPGVSWHAPGHLEQALAALVWDRGDDTAGPTSPVGVHAMHGPVPDLGAAPPHDPVGVVVPPRPHHPARIATQVQEILGNGLQKHGNRYTGALEQLLAQSLDVAVDGPTHRLLATATGSAGLRMAYEAVAGLGRGRAAVLPAFTFAASGETLVQMGYRLHLVDIEPDTWTMDPEALDEALTTVEDVGLVVCVDALGAPADHLALAAVARRHGVPVVADSAAAIGARVDGRPVAGLQHAHAYSMSFAKSLTAGGAGGAVWLPTSERPPASNMARSSLMTELHAIVGLDQLAHLDWLVARRRQVAAAYDRVLARHPRVTRQRTRPGDEHAWVHYVVSMPSRDERDRLAANLSAGGIQTKPYYAPTLDHASWPHRFDAGNGPATRGDLTVTQRLSGCVLALPMSSELTGPQLDACTDSLDRALAALRPALGATAARR